MVKRREIMRRQRVNDEYIASWFDFTPVSKPAPRKVAAAVARSKATRR
jgi:predicted house-cleaning NTP pyrophosphatase (Maf/HAM1 superfamily)